MDLSDGKYPNVNIYDFDIDDLNIPKNAGFSDIIKDIVINEFDPLKVAF
jgi:hypothetical protein